MVGFFCVTLFHIFLSVLIKREYFDDCDAVIYIVNPLKSHDIESAALLRCGFKEVVSVDDENEAQGRKYVFDEIMFYSLFSSCSGYLKSLAYKKMILVYEGITSYQLNSWSKGDALKRFDINKDIDEFWLPNTELLIDKEYQPRCKEFIINIAEMPDKELAELCTSLNAVFRYNHQAIDSDILFMDRYLTTYSSFVLNTAVENILTQVIYYGLNEKVAIKKHPYDQNYINKYRGLGKVEIIKDNVPWELMYLNNKLCNHPSGINTYIIYNSFAPANITLLFGDNSFRCLCIEPILDKYSDIESTYLNSQVTNVILNKFAQTCDVEVKFVDAIEQLKNNACNTQYATNDVLWQRAENALKEKNIDNLLEIRAFRLQVDCALISIKKTVGKYYFNADNSSAEVSRTLLSIALPEFSETKDEIDSDIIVDCNSTLVDYTKDSFDVRHFSVIEGCFRLNKLESEIEILLKGIDNIYIWGATRTNVRTFNILKKLQLTHKIRNVFDSYATGTNHDLPIVRFTPGAIGENSFIFVCAAIAYNEIAAILTSQGYKEGSDFTLGVGITDV